MNKNKINIYIKNHGKKDGIEDYISIFETILSRQTGTYQVSSRYVPGMPNIVIEEFTSYVENRELIKFKKNNPDTPIVLVLTEFMEMKWGIRALNHFGSLSDSALIAMINIFVLRRRSDLPSPSVKDWALLLLYSPIILIAVLLYVVRLGFLKVFSPRRARGMRSLNDRIYSLAYLRLRYYGLLKQLPLFDHVLSSHEQIWPQMVKNGVVDENDPRHLGVIYPEFDIEQVLNNLFIDKKNEMEITGTISRYRKKWTDKINFQILGYGLHHAIGMVQNISWGSKKTQEDRAAFSLHPPQTRDWPYSSPTRIYRALQVDGNIPVITRYFGQNPIEDVCIRYDNVETPVQMIEYWESHADACNFVAEKMKQYNDTVIEQNDAIVERILDNKK